MKGNKFCPSLKRSKLALDNCWTTQTFLVEANSSNFSLMGSQVCYLLTQGPFDNFALNYPFQIFQYGHYLIYL